jgi:hypothetical protein
MELVVDVKPCMADATTSSLNVKPTSDALNGTKNFVAGGIAGSCPFHACTSKNKSLIILIFVGIAQVISGHPLGKRSFHMPISLFNVIAKTLSRYL